MSLFRSSRALLLVPVFLAALLVVRGLPALLYVRVVGRAHALAAGFMQATSLTFIVVATTIGVETSHQRPSTARIILSRQRHRTRLRVPPALDRWLFPSPLLRASPAGTSRRLAWPGCSKVWVGQIGTIDSELPGRDGHPGPVRSVADHFVRTAPLLHRSNHGDLMHYELKLVETARKAQ